MHLRPVPHVLSVVQVVGWQLPGTAPSHAKVVFGQSELVRHGSLHCPVAPGFAPIHFAPNPQSVLLRHAVEELMFAFADTWKSLNTIRPH